MEKPAKFFLICCVVLFLPWLLQVFLCPEGCVPVGSFGNEGDFLTFQTKIEQGKQGAWKWSDPFTPETTEPARLYYFYLGLGHLAKFLNIPSAWMLQIARSLLGAGFLALWRQFCQRFRHPRTVFILGIFAGCGVFATLGIEKGIIIDLCVQGHAVFAGITCYPHYLIDGIAFLLFIEAYLYGKRRQQILAGLASGFLIGLVHPFLAVLMPVIVCAHAFFYERGKLLPAVQMSLLSFLGCAVFAVPLWVDYQNLLWLQVWREQTGAGFTFWHHLGMITIAFGLAGIFAWAAVPAKLHKESESTPEERLMAVWMAAAFLLVMLAPLPNRREYNFFMVLPVAVLSAPVFWTLKKWFSMAVPVLLILLNCAFLGTGMFEGFIGEAWNPKSYISQEFIDGLRYMEANSQPQDAVLCSFNTGMRIPYFVKQPRPYVAHVCETLYAKERAQKNRDFFFKGGPAPDDVSVKWAMVSKEWDPQPPYPKEEPVFENSAVKIWRLKN